MQGGIDPISGQQLLFSESKASELWGEDQKGAGFTPLRLNVIEDGQQGLMEVVMVSVKEGRMGRIELMDFVFLCCYRHIENGSCRRYERPEMFSTYFPHFL